ncbi:hypothetical protein [Fischerella sp. NIES-3754]|uniref:hypothetical protein n=1 Tax=Fischerella sp. NIES-3754 TaxID=1752063 RepID=UPI00072166FD|nr:hypothetical protein [Fischerella sp. NIES-3754]BAU08390.1 hypothetical protein FIS3754_43340 [Fischerella sp. NIES-3754]BCX10761.1 MAG: hypothetical protein KatS3mg066_4620 [Fischerella sp.]
MRQVRRIDLLWEGDDIEIYERLKQRAISVEKELLEFVKEIIERESNVVATANSVLVRTVQRLSARV